MMSYSERDEMGRYTVIQCCWAFHAYPYKLQILWKPFTMLNFVQFARVFQLSHVYLDIALHTEA